MKKFLVLLLVLGLLTSVSLAKKKATGESPEAATSGGMRIGIGTLGASNINCGIITIPLSMAGLRFATDTYNFDLAIGLSNTSAGGASSTASGLGTKFTYNLTSGKVTTHAGGGLAYLSQSSLISAVVLSAIYGAETYITNNFVIGVDVYPISYTSETLLGASSTNINLVTGTVYGYYMF